MRALFLALPLIATAPLIAQAVPSDLPGKADSARITAGSYAVDGRHTQVNWQVDHFGFNDYFGLFGDATGTLQIDPQNLQATKVDVTIPIASLATSNAELTGHMKSPDFFDLAKFSSARFVSTSISDRRDNRATVKGELTMLGVTKPISLGVRFSGAGANPMSKKATIGFHAVTTIKRSEWGMTKYVPNVSDDVKLRISVAFEKLG
jgi:polyisoprenoid-binding protein YceI